MNKPNCVCCETLKNSKGYIIVTIVAFALGFLFKMFISCSANVGNAAIVDVQQLINNTASVRELQAEMAVKQQDLQKWIQEAQADIAKQSQKAKKDELTKKYDEELAQKQQELQLEYAKKLTEIDKKVTKIIKKEAKAEGFDIILAKNAVIAGGKDITKEVIELVK